jgi:hypothetical protein
MEYRRGFDLRAQVGRRAEEIPSAALSAHSHLRLGTSFGRKRTSAYSTAIAAGAIPLGKSTPGGGAEGSQEHSIWLELCAGVGVDFAVQADFFKARLGPFHNLHSPQKN